MSLEAHGISDPGCVRTHNEDRILVDPILGLYSVCDGMGGHQHGELAAELAIASIRSYIEASQDSLDVSWPFGYDFAISPDANRLITSVRLANRQVWRRAEQSVETLGMGTTVAAVLITESQAVVANVGDSRVYVLRDNEMEQISIDDTWIACLADTLTPDELRQHPNRNVLTQAAGARENVDVHLRELHLEAGDIFLLCSDGLFNAVSEEMVRAILLQNATCYDRTRSLIEAAIQEHASDNVSAIVLRYS